MDIQYPDRLALKVIGGRHEQATGRSRHKQREAGPEKPDSERPSDLEEAGRIGEAVHLDRLFSRASLAKPVALFAPADAEKSRPLHS
jgi:hypothetical protein